MDWRAKVELFEQIRREYEFGIGTIAGVWRLNWACTGEWLRAVSRAEQK